ncbi:hypothetical protein BH24ACI3_BH24ACI3_00820 [soil metagenome]
MNKELVFLLEPDVGRVTVEISQTPTPTVSDLASDLGVRVNLNCAKPAEKERFLPVLQTRPEKSAHPKSEVFSIWLYRLYHDSVIDGPGRRSVVQVSGCSIRCVGCHVPQTHRRENGTLMPIHAIVDEIIARRDVHDGVTILGGEPFDQPGPVAEMVSSLKRFNLNVAIYSGRTLEDLIARRDPCVDYILGHIDLLIDGPFENSLTPGAGEYRGSSNQRFYGQAGSS